MPLSYNQGHLMCIKCGVWIKKNEIPQVTYKGKDGRLLHECGYQIRDGGRTSEATMRRTSHVHRSPFKFSRRYQIRNDIELHKEEFEQWIKKSA